MFDFLKPLLNLTSDREVLAVLGYSIDLNVSPEEWEQKKRELKQEQTLRQLARHKALRENQEMARLKTATLTELVDTYHEQALASSYALDYWKNEGLIQPTVKLHRLGFVSKCPVYFNQDKPDFKPASFVVPTYQNKQLVAIKHRIDGVKSDKYRMHVKGSAAQLFNVDRMFPSDEDLGWHFLHTERGTVIVVEGEKKAMVLDQWGFVTVGIPGLNTWQTNWLEFFNGCSKIIIVTDPDVEFDVKKRDHRDRMAQDFVGANIPVYVANMSQKPDDYFVRYGGTPEAFQNLLRWGRKVR